MIDSLSLTTFLKLERQNTNATQTHSHTSDSKETNREKRFLTLSCSKHLGTNINSVTDINRPSSS